jgi:hypothetical protein
MEVSGRIHNPADSPPGKEPSVLNGEEAGRVRPRASVDAVVKRKKSLPLPGIECWSSNL